jgi:hypothetical protein
MSGLVSWSSDGSIGIQSYFIVIAVELSFSLFLVDSEDLLKFNETRVLGVQLRDEFA